MILFTGILFRKIQKDNLDVEGFWYYIKSFSVDVMKPLKIPVQSKHNDSFLSSRKKLGHRIAR